MRTVAIFNIWHDWDWLDISYANISPVVDGIIVVASTRSNHGEYSPIPDRWKDKMVVREPKFHIPMHSETDKRNFGLEMAKKQGYTHFLMLDADEMYHQDQVLEAKERFHVEHDLQGLVCPCNVYFGSVNLTLGRDITLVPFIHKITPTLKFEFNKRYPNAWINGQIRIDPTRSMNINSGVEYTEEIVMEHYSWVRADYEKKIRNSTARKNLEASNILTQVRLAKAGDYIDFYRKSLVPATVDFGIDGKIFDPPIHKGIQLHST